ncbi:hypothetical protein [Bradyrhizobium sp. USDA 4506]
MTEQSRPRRKEIDLRSAAKNVTLLVMLVTAAGSSFPVLAQTEGALLSSIKKSGSVKVVRGLAAPVVGVSPEGQASSYFVDLVLKRLGLPPLAPVLMAWNAQAPALRGHQVDLVDVASNTDEPARRWASSASFFIKQRPLYVLPENPKQVTSVSQIARSPRST